MLALDQTGFQKLLLWIQMNETLKGGYVKLIWATSNDTKVTRLVRIMKFK